VQYDTRVMEYPVYGRVDYSYTGKYMRSTGPGSSSFNAAFFSKQKTAYEIHNMNARVGFYYKDLEIAGYVKNLFNGREWVSKGQGSGTYYFNGSTTPPPVIRVQMNHRFQEPPLPSSLGGHAPPPPLSFLCATPPPL